jgi:hypothetical protein
MRRRKDWLTPHWEERVRLPKPKSKKRIDKAQSTLIQNPPTKLELDIVFSEETIKEPALGKKELRIEFSEE